MNINSVSSVSEGYSNVSSDTSVKNNGAAAATAPEQKAPETGVVFEQSNAAPIDTAKQTYTPNTAIVDQLKADAKARQDQLMSYVQQLMSGQGNALAEADDVWKFLASGNFTVSEAAKQKAQEAISEDGYWGVKQTSDRIIEFAKSLSGGDPSKIDSLKEAFQKGFKEATKTWGRDLPDISNQTYDAVMKKFDDWANESKKSDSTQNQAQNQTMAPEAAVGTQQA